MTLSDWELWACAYEMIRQHGADAAIRASLRADQMIERGDIDGFSTWLLIIRRIEELLAPPQQPH